MGCDIHIYAERNDNGVFKAVFGDFEEGRFPFDYRSYGMFGFLADVRNYSAVPTIVAPRGFPADASKEVSEEYSDWGSDAHTASWITLGELTAFNYDAEIEDRRTTRKIGPNMWSGACTAEPGNGVKTTMREFLGEGFFNDLAELQRIGASRIVFWFDN